MNERRDINGHVIYREYSDGFWCKYIVHKCGINLSVIHNNGFWLLRNVINEKVN